MIKPIIAIETDGLEMRRLSMRIDIPSEDFDYIHAIKMAVTDFCKTEYGRRIYDYNCSSFNWGDFISYVPNSICEKYGFSVVGDDLIETEVDWNENLVFDDEIRTGTEDDE